MSDSGSRLLTVVAGLIILAVGVLGAIRTDGGGVAGASRSGFSGGESRMSPGARRFWAIVLAVFGACVVVGSVAV